MEHEILALFEEWNAAAQSRDPDRVVALYAPDAVLLPTVSNQIRRNHTEMRAYFVDFLALGPAAVLEDYNLRELGSVAINSGVYTFTFASPPPGAFRVVTARYTFVYERRGGRWPIIEHHSSRMPEGEPAGGP